MATELSKKSQETEEGEIIDDDDDDGNFNINDLEAISDSSLPPAGKCDTSKDYIQVISSSSLSETDLSPREYFRKKHHKRKHCKFLKKKKLHHHFHRRHHHHKRRHRRHHDSSSSYSNDSNDGYYHISDTPSISSSDDYMMFNKSLLKAAVHVNNSVLQKNSLQSRLKAMTLISETSTDIQNQIVDSIERQVNKEENSKDDDYELIELRLAALQTAILNKKNLRKKRKMIEMEQAEENKEKEKGKLDMSETEISTNLEKKPCLEIEPETEPDKKNNGLIETSLDEDEDVLRALLLASMAKKITKEPSKITKVTNNFQQITNDTKKTINNTTKIGVSHDEQNLNSKINGNRKLIPQIFTSTTNKINNVLLPKKLVKKAPAVITPPQVHTKVKPIIIQLNNDSDSDDADVSKTKNTTVKEQPKVNSIESTVEKFLREQKAKRESEMAKKKETNESNIFEKSCVKLLPKSKQIEYQILVQRLKNAQKRPQKLKKPQNKLVKNENVSIVNNSKKIVRNKFNTSKQIENKILNGGGGDQVEIPDLVEDARKLQKAIKEMQSKTSRRLQMQEKYTVLTPIVKKINEASIERKKCDKEIKRLQEALAGAMTNLRQTHLNFKQSVKELIEKKAEIDKKSSPTKQLPVTSTPLKEKSSVPFESTSASTILSGTADNSNKENLNVNDKCNLISTEMTDDRNFGDPNDIDKIYDIVPKYISPLDSNNRSNLDDPFTIMCPYDINGNCRDPECKYKHYRE